MNPGFSNVPNAPDSGFNREPKTAGESHDSAGDGERTAPIVPLRFVAFALAALATWALAPLWAPLVLAVWTAVLVRPLYTRLERRLPGKSRAAGAVTVLLVILLLCPLALLGVFLAGAVADLFEQAEKWRSAGGPLSDLLPAGNDFSLESLTSGKWVQIAREHGASAFKAFSITFGALTAASIAAVVYVFAFHAALVHGTKAHRWVLDRAPVPRRAIERLGDAFVETGRGLIIGIGLTALLQGLVVTAGYVIAGVPQALLLGFVTTIGALVPAVGTAVVWAPVVVVLFATGESTGALVVLGFGLVASITDNFVRPWLSRYGKLELHTFVVFVAMLGGIAAFGGLGLILGPLYVRLAVEVLDIWREQRSHAKTPEERRVAPGPAASRAAG